MYILNIYIHTHIYIYYTYTYTMYINVYIYDVYIVCIYINLYISIYIHIFLYTHICLSICLLIYLWQIIGTYSSKVLNDAFIWFFSSRKEEAFPNSKVLKKNYYSLFHEKTLKQMYFSAWSVVFPVFNGPCF